MLAQMMLRVGYQGYEEGNLLGLLHALSDAVDQHFTWFGTDNPAVLMAMSRRPTSSRTSPRCSAACSSAITRSRPGSTRPATRRVIEIIPTLVRLWPEARFIFAKRRGIENVVSRLSKFPEHSFEYHLQDWAKNMRAWRLVKAELPTLAGIEVDQQDMLRDPIGVAVRIGRLLGLSPLQQAQIVGHMTSERPQQSHSGSAERVLSLADPGWSPDDVARFMRHCKAEMDAYGYTMDERYRD